MLDPFVWQWFLRSLIPDFSNFKKQKFQITDKKRN